MTDRKRATPALDLSPVHPPLHGVLPPSVPLPTSEQRAQSEEFGDFGSLLGRAAKKSVDETILTDRHIASFNAEADSVSISSETEQRIVYYAIRTIELSKGNFDFRVNYRFENPRSDLANAAEGVLAVQGYRDRLCQLEIELRQAKKKLDSAYDTGVAYLFEVYAKKMETFGRDTFMRGLFVSKVFKPLEAKRSDVRSLLEQISSALSNLDKAHFAYKTVVDVGMTILNRVEGRAG